ncbi:MAG: hypothetical protein V3V14_08285 [Saprospiraceae bacterium]
MSLEFDERFFTEEIRDEDFPHYLERAKWIDNYIEPDSIVYILGCGFGYLVKHLRDLGVNTFGVDIGDYANQNKKSDYIFKECVATINLTNADYIFSWNMLDCLDETIAPKIATNLNKHSVPQIHIVCCLEDVKSAQSFLEQGYFIKSIQYWQNLMPNAMFVEYNTEKVYGVDSLKIPLSAGKVSD